MEILNYYTIVNCAVFISDMCVLILYACKIIIIK